MVTIISSHWALIAMEEDMVLPLRINLHHSLVYSFHLRQLKYFELFFSSLTLYQPYSEKVSLVICNVFGTQNIAFHYHALDFTKTCLV